MKKTIEFEADEFAFLKSFITGMVKGLPKNHKLSASMQQQAYLLCKILVKLDPDFTIEQS